jgi:hypothetical protein
VSKLLRCLQQGVASPPHERGGSVSQIVNPWCGLDLRALDGSPEDVLPEARLQDCVPSLPGEDERAGRSGSRGGSGGRPASRTARSGCPRSVGTKQTQAEGLLLRMCPAHKDTIFREAERLDISLTTLGRAFRALGGEPDGQERDPDTGKMGSAMWRLPSTARQSRW